MKGMVLLLMAMMLSLWVVRSGGILLRWPYGHFSKVRSMTFRARLSYRSVLMLLPIGKRRLPKLWNLPQTPCICKGSGRPEGIRKGLKTG